MATLRTCEIIEELKRLDKDGFDISYIIEYMRYIPTITITVN